VPDAKRKLLIDAQLPPALARAIAQLGHLSEHVLDIGLLQASDDAIWRYAEASGAILITKDEDFAIRGRRALETVPVVWLRLGNTSRKALLERFLPLIPQVMLLIAGGETLVEIRPRQRRATIRRSRR
jgi:predicted nuclease of predicted toxin-antitoxin system